MLRSEHLKTSRCCRCGKRNESSGSRLQQFLPAAVRCPRLCPQRRTGRRSGGCAGHRGWRRPRVRLAACADDTGWTGESFWQATAADAGATTPSTSTEAGSTDEDPAGTPNADHRVPGITPVTEHGADDDDASSEPSDAEAPPTPQPTTADPTPRVATPKVSKPQRKLDPLRTGRLPISVRRRAKSAADPGHQPPWRVPLQIPSSKGVARSTRQVAHPRTRTSPRADNGVVVSVVSSSGVQVQPVGSAR